MPIMIIDDEGVHTIEHETIMCQECCATNEGYRKKCKNCGSKLVVITTKVISHE